MMTKPKMQIYHEPVMANEVLSFIPKRKTNIAVDCTLGDGGHTWEILSANPSTFVLGIDVDDEAIEVSQQRLFSKFNGRFQLAKYDYRRLQYHLANLGISKVGAILLDLGVSSRQLDQAHRGFSFMVEAPLDMRMNPMQQKTAGDVLSESDEKTIERILKRYGEERFAKQIARAITKYKTKQKISTTTELVEIIKSAIPARARYGSIHPARRTFQALRIATNDELSQLRCSLYKCFDLLEPKGVLIVITYHSLEDRIVKRVFKQIEDKKIGVVRTRRVVRPTKAEILKNSRSRSAKLRVVQK